MEIDLESLAERNTVSVSFKERPTVVNLIDLLVESGLFMTRAEFYREACKEKLKETLDNLTGDGKEAIMVVLASISESKLEKIDEIIKTIASLKA